MMSVFPFIVVAWILAVGLYGVVTSRHLVHQIIGLIAVQSSTYVLLLGVGYVTGAVAPYFFDVPDHTPAVDPVVQGGLTDVVVEAAVTALLQSVAVKAHKRLGTLVPHELGVRQGAAGHRQLGRRAATAVSFDRRVTTLTGARSTPRGTPRTGVTLEGLLSRRLVPARSSWPGSRSSGGACRCCMAMNRARGSQLPPAGSTAAWSTTTSPGSSWAWPAWAASSP